MRTEAQRERQRRKRARSRDKAHKALEDYCIGTGASRNLAYSILEAALGIEPTTCHMERMTTTECNAITAFFHELTDREAGA